MPDSKPQQWDGVQKLVSESIDSCDVDIHAVRQGYIFTVCPLSYEHAFGLISFGLIS
jgi:hypothetical protein